MLWFLACGPRTSVPEALPGQLTILHTNDLHGHYLAEDGAGGMEWLDAYADAHKAAGNTLMLDAGDILSGTPLTDLHVRGVQGGAMLELMEAVGYDAWALGNHEFDKGQENTQALVSAARIPTLNANLRRGTQPGLDGLLPHIVLEENGITVGVIGLVTEGLDKMVSSRAIEGLTVERSSDAVRREMEAMGEVDLVVVLSHIGLEADRALAAQVDGIDLIVGGHSHTFLHEPQKVNDTWIVQAGEYAHVLGVVDLQVLDGQIEHFTSRLVQLDGASAPGVASPLVSDLVRRYDAEIREVYDVVLSHAATALDRDYHHQSGLGGWTTGMLREATGADVAIYNSGGLREDIPAGPVTRRTLYQVFPFANKVVTFELSGDELTTLVLSNCFRELNGSSWMQISGVEVEWRERMDSPELLSVTLEGEPIDPKRTYTVATNSYVVDQGPRLLGGLTPHNPQELPYTVLDAAVQAAERGPIAPARTDNYVRR